VLWVAQLAVLSNVSASVAFPISVLVSLGASALAIGRLERIAARLGLREATLGLAAALAANGPEITAAVTGLARGQHEIGVGVVLGSNVFNLAALLGLGALSAGRIQLHRDVMIFAGTVASIIAFISVGAASGTLAPGLALGLALVVFVPYVLVSSVSPATLIRWPLPSRVGTGLARAVTDEEAEIAAAIDPRPARPVDVVVGVVAVGVVIASSIVMEYAASAIGENEHISGILVGGVILAALTSLPNAVSAIYLAHRGRGSAVLSTALNSNTLNVLFGLLVPAVIVGLGHYGSSGVLVAVWYTGLTIGALILAYRGRGLGRSDGAVLVGAYLGLVVVLATR
jgi:cation:H+ antiporter